MHNLRTALPLCRHEIVVFADSDVELTGPRHLLALTRPLADDRVGLVTAAPIYRAPVTPGGFLLATMINADLWVYFALLFLTGNMNVANGALLAARRSVLANTGDLEDLQYQLLNDTVLARKVRESGRRVVLSPMPAVIPTPSLSFSDWWRQVVRWHVAMRSVLPGLEYVLYGYHRSGALLGLVCFLLVGPSPFRPLFLLVPALARVLSCSLQFVFWLREPRALVEIPLAVLLDLLSPVIWLLSWVEKTVWWRGRAYRVRRGGIAEEIGHV
jgi:cellulose synthase/poly-beta-1,6-N-acetylglucosamine synthase-like glycosyltransferase